MPTDGTPKDPHMKEILPVRHLRQVAQAKLQFEETPVNGCSRTRERICVCVT